MGNPLLCEVCGIACTLSCAKCKNVHYCSREHQKSHWSTHKTRCFPVKIIQDDVRGRHLIATRDISQGEIILKELPLLSGPSFQAADNKRIVCIACYKVIVSEFRCSKCKWPVCDKNCEQNETHATLECPVLAEATTPDDDCFNLYYRTVFIIRGLLLKEKNPEKWKKLTQLESHMSKRMVNKEMFVTPVNFIHSNCGLDRYSEEEIQLVSGILNTNSMASDDGPLDSPLELPRFGSYVYYSCSMISHGCIPNTVRIIQSDSEIYLRSTIAIKGGQFITTAYLDVLRGTLERQRHFHLHYYFQCSCARCIDPTELGTHFSSIKCTESKCAVVVNEKENTTGYLLPIDISKGDSSDWRCNNEKCSTIVSNERIHKIIKDLESEINDIGLEDNLENIELLENIIKKCGVILHPNHHLAYVVRYDLLQRIDYVLSASLVTETKTRIALTKREVELTSHNLAISDVLVPGFSRIRGRLIYFLQKAKLMILLFQIDVNKLLKNNSMKNDLLKEFQDLMNLRKTGYNILRYEPKTRDEGYLAEAMLRDDNAIYSMKQYFDIAVL